MQNLQITINGETIDVDKECAGCNNFYDLMCHTGGSAHPYSGYYQLAQRATATGMKCDNWRQREDDEATEAE